MTVPTRSRSACFIGGLAFGIAVGWVPTLADIGRISAWAATAACILVAAALFLLLLKLHDKLSMGDWAWAFLGFLVGQIAVYTLPFFPMHELWHRISDLADAAWARPPM